MNFSTFYFSCKKHVFLILFLVIFSKVNCQSESGDIFNPLNPNTNTSWYRGNNSEKIIAFQKIITEAKATFTRDPSVTSLSLVKDVIVVTILKTPD